MLKVGVFLPLRLLHIYKINNHQTIVMRISMITKDFLLTVDDQIRFTLFFPSDVIRVFKLWVLLR
jgi:hypothetical protein